MPRDYVIPLLEISQEKEMSNSDRLGTGINSGLGPELVSDQNGSWTKSGLTGTISGPSDLGLLLIWLII